MKRILSLLVALIMMLGLVGTAVAEEFTYPMDGTVAISINFGGENLDNNAKSAEEAFANPEKYLFNAIGVVSEAAGVYVYSNGASWDSGSEEFQYMLLGGELPDILVNNFNKTYTGGAAAAIEAGYIIDLNPYTDWMPNYMAYLDENPDVRMQVTIDDGKLWGCAGVEDTYSMYKDRGIVLRKDILDALDLEVPTTFDEFEAVLYAVKEAYPDMIPFSSEMRWMYLQHMFSSLSNAYNCSYPFYCVDGENVEFAMYSEGYKTFLQRIATWYEDGLIDPDFASINKGGVRGKLANGEVFAANQQASNSATSVKSCTIEGAEFVAIPALVLNEGDPVRNYSLSGMKIYQNSTGWAANVSITQGGEPLQSGVVCAGDFVRVENLPDLVIYFNAFYPDYVARPGALPATASSDVNNPAYLYTVYYQDQILGMNALMEGEELTIDDYTVLFSDPQPYTLLEIKVDRFALIALHELKITGDDSAKRIVKGPLVAADAHHLAFRSDGGVVLFIDRARPFLPGRA